MKDIVHIYNEPASYTNDLIRNVDSKLSIDYYFLNDNSWYNNENKYLKRISIFDIIKIILSKKIIIINGFLNFPFLAFFFLRLFGLSRYKIGIESDTHFGYSKKSKLRHLIKKTIFSRKFIFGLAGGREEHIEYFTKNGMAESRVFLLPMVIDSKKFEKKIIPLKKKVKYFFIGKFDYSGKNLKFLINSFIIAQSYNSNIELHLIGHGKKYDNFYKKYSKYKFIYFIGKINNDDLSKYIKNFHYLILPSIHEAWGLVVNESFCNGKLALVSKNVGCVKNFKNHIMDWMIFDPINQDSLVNSILESIKYDNYQEHAKEASCFIREKWNYDLYIKNLKKFISNVS